MHLRMIVFLMVLALPLAAAVEEDSAVAPTVTHLEQKGLSLSLVRIRSDQPDTNPHVRAASCDTVTPELADDYVLFSGWCDTADVPTPPLTTFGQRGEEQVFKCQWSGAVTDATAVALCMRGTDSGSE